MQRRHFAAIASLIFAALWAASAWPWFATAGHPARTLPVPWSLCGLFVVVAVGVAAGKPWGRWLGLAAAVILLVLLPITLVAAYFMSFFGDQAFQARMAAWFLAAIALSAALVVLLAKPLDVGPAAKEPQTASRQSFVWIPFAFSVVYVIGSWVAVLYALSTMSPAGGTGVDTALFFTAVPSIVLLWLTWVWWSRRSNPWPLGVLLALGFIIPLVVISAAYGMFTAKLATERQRTERQLANAHLSDFTDELLLSAHGNPIGIRLRYTIRFDEGLDDFRYRPMVTLSFESPHVAMSQLRAATDPSVAGRFAKGEYRFTEDFVPYFFPAGIMQPSQAREQANNRCFYWGFPGARELVKDAEAKRATISMSFPRSLNDHTNRSSFTTLAYSLDAFYDGAIREGARDCP